MIANQIAKVVGEEKAIAALDLGKKLYDKEGDYGDDYVAVPFIQLYDDDVYTALYDVTEVTNDKNEKSLKAEYSSAQWLGLNNSQSNFKPAGN